MRGLGGPALGSPVRIEVPRGPPGSELRSRSQSRSCAGDLARLAQPWGRHPGQGLGGSGQLSPVDGRLRNEESPGKRVGRDDCLLSTYCIRPAPDRRRPIQAHKTPCRRSPSVHLALENASPGRGAPVPGRSMSRVQARVCPSVSLCLQSPPRAHGLPAQSFPGILSYRLNAPHPSQLFPLMKAPLSFPGRALSQEG